MSHSSIYNKELPPVPDSGDTLLQPKSFNRRNVHKLSFPAPSLPDAGPLPGAPTRLKAPLLLDRSSDHSAPHAMDAPLLLNELRISPVVAEHSVRGAGAKRQTVISSYSPTKSIRNVENGLGSLPSTPRASTPTSNGLKDSDLVHVRDLGAGNYGAVLKVFHVPLQKTMARKIVNVDLRLDVQIQILRELRILHECRSPYIVEFYGAFLRSNNSVVLCMEYCNCGSLDKLAELFFDKPFPLAVLKVLLYSILSGLNYLYDTHKIIHRDIKPSNVLMTHRGEFKLCDFGVSRELTNSVALADTFVGTSTYMSPERIQGNLYSIKSDVWSMGLMLYELASGLSPWADAEPEGVPAVRATKTVGAEGILDLLQRIVNEESPTLRNIKNKFTKEPFDPDMCQFVDKCLIKDDQQRADTQSLLKEPFLEKASRGDYNKEVKAWAKIIRKLLKEDG